MDWLMEPLMNGADSVAEYLAEHVITCLIPAFFIAGAIAAFIKKDAILKYFGPDAKKTVSYALASVSGTVLAVCSCTILPLFAGIYKKGSGIGPATTFLFAGPAINVLAVIYTAQVLGYDLGMARAISAIVLSVLVGLTMSVVFRNERTAAKGSSMPTMATGGEERPGWVTLAFFGLMVAILVIGASKLEWVPKLAIVYVLTIVVAVLLIYFFKRDEVTEWGYETWDLTRKIFPILIAGTFVVGVIAYYLPPETFADYLGGNSLGSVLLGSVIGTILYMPTLLEVPIIGTTFGYTDGVMGGGPALALLLSGPTISLPSLVVLYRIMGGRKTLMYTGLVILFSTVGGMVYGNLFA
jgi:uncharacterized membrane protein YraQ (UPF0718 family)